MNLLTELAKNPFLLAPMAGITNSPFRLFMRELGCGIVISELVSANGIKYDGRKSRQLMRYVESERPVGIQLFGENIENLSFSAKAVQDAGADFVDLNLGCPVKKVVKKGAGSALLRDPKELVRVLRAMKENLSIPLTIKIRTGWDEGSRNALEIAQIAYDEGITWVAIHGRTRAQGYSGLADWEFITDLAAKAPLPIIGNGDLTSPEKIVERWQQSGCAGVMVGRGCLKNPFIFQQAQEYLREKTYHVPEDYSHTLKRLIHLFGDHFDQPIAHLHFKKFAAWFSAGYPESSSFRREIFAEKDPEIIFARTESFFHQAVQYQKEDTSHQPFLMGGHG